MYLIGDLKVLGVTELGDGTRTISVTDGSSAIDIVATFGCEGVANGDYIVGAFTLVNDLGTPQFRPLCDDSLFWIEIQ